VRAFPLLLAAALAVTGGAAATVVAAGGGATAAVTPADLPACPFFSDVTPPPRSPTPWVPPRQQAPPLDLSGRLPAPGNIHGALSGGAVTIGFDRVAGAHAYRVFRNGQSVAWISDWGQASLSAVDHSPCRHAFYSIVAMSDESGSGASYGQYAKPYRLEDGGSIAPFGFTPGSTLHVMVTSYNDGGQTASGYTTKLGVCAVDTRIIPWGTRFTVPGYGSCYAADIGLWIQNNTVDVWLPGDQANGWGVQMRDLVFQ
jgi:3D (Asp-Asp-Asp) domain-containing protein